MNMAHNNIRYYRKRAGLSQEELADKAKISKCTVTNLERTGSQPSEKVRQKLAKVLSVDEEALCGFDSPFVSSAVSYPKVDGDYLCAYKVHPRAKLEYQVLHYSTALRSWSTNYSSVPVGDTHVKFWMDIPDLPYLI